MNRAWIWPAVCFLLLSTAAAAEMISEAKSSANWMQVTVEGIVTYLEPDECYIEAPDRSAGILVFGPTVGIDVGDPVTALGTFSVVMGEPAIVEASIYLPHGGERVPIRPFGMSNRTIGGASLYSPMWIWDYTRICGEVPGPCGEPVPGWERVWVHARGANNTGLLVKTWGTVRSICESPVNGAKWLYVDDGSGVVSDFGDTGVLVYADAEVQIGDRVSVTGVSSVEPSLEDSSRLVRVVRARDAGDVQIIHREEPGYPFSDEFDSPTLDPRWLVLPGRGTLSTTAEPGWLAITVDPRTGPVISGGPEIVQWARGDWNADIKMRLSPHPAVEMWQMGIVASKFVPGDGTWRDREIPFEGDYHYRGRGLICLGFAGQFGDEAQVKGMVYLGHSYLDEPMPGDTCYLHFRRQEGHTFGSASFDGMSYSKETELSSLAVPFITLTAASMYSVTPIDQGPFTCYFDYIRFTPIASEGGQQ